MIPQPSDLETRAPPATWNRVANPIPLFFEDVSVERRLSLLLPLHPILLLASFRVSSIAQVVILIPWQVTSSGLFAFRTLSSMGSTPSFSARMSIWDSIANVICGFPAPLIVPEDGFSCKQGRRQIEHSRSCIGLSKLPSSLGHRRLPKRGRLRYPRKLQPSLRRVFLLLLLRS